MAPPRVPQVDYGAGRPASGDSARAALVNPVSQAEATQRARGSNIAAGFDGLATLAKNAAEMFKKQDVDRDQIMAVEMEGRLMRLNDEGMAKLDPMAPDYAQQVKELIKQNTAGVLADSQFRTREVQDETSRRFARIAAATEIQGVNARQKSIALEAERVYQTRLEELYAKIRRDPAKSELYQSEFQADAVRLRVGISPDRLRALAEVAADGMLQAKVEGLAQNGQFAAARKFLDDNAFRPETNRMLRGVINSLEDKAQRNHALASSEYAARIRIEIIKQLDPDARPTVTREQLDADVKSGRLRAQDADNLYAMLHSADKQRNQEIELNRIAIRNVMTPGAATNDDVNRVFRVYLGDAIGRKGDKRDHSDPLSRQEAVEVAGALAIQTGIVPPMYSQYIENLANAGGTGSDVEVANLAKAVAAYKAIKDSAPGAKWTFEKNDRLALVLEHAKANGGDIVQAARDVMKAAPKDPKTNAERVLQGRALLRNVDVARETQVVLGDWLSRQLSSAGSGVRWLGRTISAGQLTDALGMGSVIPKGERAPDIPIDLQTEYKENFLRHYRLTGNAELAKAAALEQIKAEWQVTYVAGDKTPYVMKNAPASFLPPERSWLREHIDKMMHEAVTKMLRTKGWVPVSEEVSKGLPAFRLVSDELTKADVVAKRAPSFMVEVLRENRVYHAVTRVAMPNEEELKARFGRERLEQFDATREAQGARQKLEDAAKRRADKRRGQ